MLCFESGLLLAGRCPGVADQGSVLLRSHTSPRVSVDIFTCESKPPKSQQRPFGRSLSVGADMSAKAGPSGRFGGEHCPASPVGTTGEPTGESKALILVSFSSTPVRPHSWGRRPADTITAAGRRIIKPAGEHSERVSAVRCPIVQWVLLPVLQFIIVLTAVLT